MSEITPTTSGIHRQHRAMKRAINPERRQRTETAELLSGPLVDQKMAHQTQCYRRRSKQRNVYENVKEYMYYQSARLYQSRM